MKNLEEDILQNHSKSIVHMRSQIGFRRFGLVFGAGIGSEFGFPTWPNLIEGIAKHKSVNAPDFLNKHSENTSVSQILFQNFKNNALEKLDENFDEYDRLNSYLQSKWNKIVHDVLYEDVPELKEDLTKLSTYLVNYIKIIQETKLTVNYNFDDILEKLLSYSRSETAKKGNKRLQNCLGFGSSVVSTECRNLSPQWIFT